MLHIFCLHFWQSKKKKKTALRIFSPVILLPGLTHIGLIYFTLIASLSMLSSIDVQSSLVSWGALFLFCAQPHSVVLYKCGPVDFLKAMLILKAVFLPSYCIAKRGNPQQTWSSRAENCWKLAIEMVFSFLLTNKHLPIVPCCSSLEVGNSLPFHILATISCTWVG